jgi:cyclohexanone monooxygenase
VGARGARNVQAVTYEERSTYSEAEDPGGGTHVDAVVVGAGFAGLCALYRLREAGYSVQAFEAGAGVGGTWYWNRYPGARCDTESVDYSYSFSDQLQQEWTWSERYATQPEILSYLEHVADRFDLRSGIAFETRVTRAQYQEAPTDRWSIVTDDGRTYVAKYCVMATGVLSALKQLDVPGIETFTGDLYHTARWPKEGVDFSGRRVGIIGTGSTGVQLIPVVAAKADRLVVFQRTPNFSAPARNRPLDEGYMAAVKKTYAERREEARMSGSGMPAPPSRGSALDYEPDERERVYEAAWSQGGGPTLLRAFSDIGTNIEANDTAANFVRKKIRQIVIDPEVAQKLLPTDHPLGTKRICVDTDYYKTFNRPNVTLADVRAAPIQEIVPDGLRTADAMYQVDTIVFATGFDAITGALLEMDIRGRNGRTLADAWASGPRSYLGIGVAGFPNLFTITGPGSPSVLGNVVTSIEQHVDFVMDCIRHMNEHGAEAVEVTPEAEQRWVEHVNELALATLHPRAKSWYMGANIPGKPRVFLPFVGGVGTFRKICDDVAANGYEGFAFS